ncbi:MAG: RidA family protein [Desulfotignum sp.]|nr:RidA family protein [Desulfotignum sp.]
MSRQIIATDQAPKAIGPYSQAVAVNGFLFTSGQIPLDPSTGQLITGTIEEQAHQVFRNLSAIAEKAGAGLADAVKTTVFLSDINDFKAVNAVYDQYFSEPFPARSAFQVGALPLNAGIEVEAVFLLPS